MIWSADDTQNCLDVFQSGTTGQEIAKEVNDARRRQSIFDCMQTLREYFSREGCPKCGKPLEQATILSRGVLMECSGRDCEGDRWISGV